MNNPHHIKTIILGDHEVGKSAFLKRWNEDVFLNDYEHTKDIDFITKLLNRAFATISMKIWDLACGDDPNKRKAYLKGTHIFFVMISCDDEVAKRTEQIYKWRAYIKENLKDDNYHIVFIENKIDVGNQFTPVDINPLLEAREHFVAVSTRNASNFNRLENKLWDIFPQFIPELQTPTSLVPLLANIEQLSDEQAEQVLSRIENFLINGTTNKIEKPYELTLFGGINYQYETQRHDMPPRTMLLPEHVPGLLNTIQHRSNISAKDILKKIYSDSTNAAQVKGVTRKSSTHTFYEYSLPNYIQRSIDPEVLNVHNNINRLNRDQILAMLNNIKDTILAGANGNRDNPYILGFWGGVTYQYDRYTIKLPQHLAIMVNNIDLATRKVNLTLNEAQLCLSDVYQQTIAASLIPNSRRHTSTQIFYQTTLPNMITSKIAEPLPASPNVGPSLRLVE